MEGRHVGTVSPHHFPRRVRTSGGETRGEVDFPRRVGKGSGGETCGEMEGRRVGTRGPLHV